MPSAGPNVPRHVAIIMDGNGRWAKQRGLPRIEGHRRGVETVRSIIDAARELGIQYLTLYAFSAENWQRPPDEVSALMSLLELFLRREAKTLIKNRIRLHTIGRIEELPAGPLKELKRAIAATQEFTDWNLVLALNYGSRTELADAARAYADAVVFDAAKISDTATFELPKARAVGIDCVLVNGAYAYRRGDAEPGRSGRFLARGPNARTNSRPGSSRMPAASRLG